MMGGRLVDRLARRPESCRDEWPVSVEERVRQVRQAAAEAARRAGRDPRDVILVAATKTVGVEAIRRARDAGIAVCGENRIQEAAAKVGQVEGIVWHLIGKLQRNKARRAVELFDLIHSLDSLRLGETLDRLGVERSRPVRALIEVNLGGEASKAGVSPDQVAELAEALAGRAGLAIEGLMTIPPPADGCEPAREHFRQLRRLAQRITAMRMPGVAMKHLSMGMSADFEVAIEEGATLVRVGSAIFGPRNQG